MNNIGLSNCFDMHTVWKWFPDFFFNTCHERRNDNDKTQPF